MARNRSFSPLPPWQRSDHCGTLRAADAGREVALFGWAAARRDHGGLVFIDLRDREGIVQLVFNPAHAPEAHRVAQEVRTEYFLAVRGRVVHRTPATVNAELLTGEIEIAVSAVEILNSSEAPPFPLTAGAAEDVRLRYRYLDLRRAEMQRNLRRRHLAVKGARAYLDAEGFVEIETPILWRATPEGARDYLVPSRVNPGKFYALPQSPQLLKQLLMIGGFDRYYQIARCFRDEDLRANRQPEFSQVDIEMTCPRREDVMRIGEGMIASMYRHALGVDVGVPFARLGYQEAMERFGTDKPDLRFGLEIKDLSAAFAGTGLRVFADALARGDSVYGLALKRPFELARRELDEMAEEMRSKEGLGLAWARLGEREWQGPIARHLGAGEREAAACALEAGAGDLVLMMAGPRDRVRPLLGELRLKLAARLDLRKADELRFLWVVDFPLVEYSDEERRLVAHHHPFTAPHPDDLDRLWTGDPLSVRALSYDMVLNGQEIGGGSIRIHNRDLQLRVLELLGFSQEEAVRRFGFLLEALGYGAPPHGGIAFGVERISMLLCGTDSLRDVMAFPKTQKAVDPMSGAPSEVDPAQLRELSIKVVP